MKSPYLFPAAQVIMALILFVLIYNLSRQAAILTSVSPVQEKEVWDLALEQGVLGAPAVRNHRSCTLCVCGKEIVTR